MSSDKSLNKDTNFELATVAELISTIERKIEVLQDLFDHRLQTIKKWRYDIAMKRRMMFRKNLWYHPYPVICRQEIKQYQSFLREDKATINCLRKEIPNMSAKVNLLKNYCRQWQEQARSCLKGKGLCVEIVDMIMQHIPIPQHLQIEDKK